MGKILRLAGVLFTVGGLFILKRAYDHFATNVPTSIYLETLGNGLGSRYRICDATGPAVEKFTSVDFATKPASDVKNYFYSIQNPKAYLLDGDDAVVTEKGPYTLRKYSINHNIGFRESALTSAAEPNEKGAIEFDVANAYVVLDETTTVTSNLKRSTSDLSLSWSGENVALPSVEAAMPSHLSMSDEVTNLSPAYLSALGALNDEFSLVLSLSCTSEQVANIPLAGTGTGEKIQCDASQMNDYRETNCACCMLNDDHTSSTDGPLFLNCNDFVDESSAAMSTLSLLASYDGGVAVKEAGETKYDGSGDTFIETKHGQTSFHSAVIQTQSVNDILFGHPSAFIGKVVPSALLSTAKAANTTLTDTVDTAKAMLTGQMDELLPFKLGNVAQYTKAVGSVCYATCEAVDPSDALFDSPLGWTCTGNAPDRYQTSNADEIVFGGIDCKPYSSTYATTKQCSAIETHLSSNSNDPEYDACVCADGSSDWEAEGCCLAAGKLDGEDLTGSGCLYHVAGVVGSNYVGMDSTASGNQRTVDLGAAMKAWTTKEPSMKSSLFMCPGPGLGIAEHSLFNRYETYQGASEYNAYYDTGRPRIQQDDKSLTTAVPHAVAASTGTDETYFPPKGFQFTHGDLSISGAGTANPWVDHPVYVTSAKMPVSFKNDRDFGYTQTRPKACGSDTCLVVARMRTLDSAFVWANETKHTGRGMPYNGLQPIGHSDGPSDSGRPAYFHQPLFLNGDEELLSQQNNSHVDNSASGNGLQIHRSKDETSDPGQFTVGAVNAGYELVQSSAWVDDDGNNLRSYFDLEPATGITVRSRMRFGKSYSIWECDPEGNGNCDLARKPQATGTCYGTVGTEQFDGLSQTRKDDLEASGVTSFTYPCSAANVLTPNVIGGKIMPHYSYEEFSSGASKAEMDQLVSLGRQNQSSHRWWNAWFLVAFLSVSFGAAMALGVSCFEQRPSPVIQAQPVDADNSKEVR